MDCRLCENYTYRKGKPYCPFGIFMLACEHYSEAQGVVHAIPVEGLDIKAFTDKLIEMQGSKDNE